MLQATQLGHLVLDAPVDTPFVLVDSPWTDWPTIARARAFAAMLLMPKGGVANEIGPKEATPVVVDALMTRFGTGRLATTWHLKNLGVISEDERAALLSGEGV